MSDRCVAGLGIGISSSTGASGDPDGGCLVSIK